MKTQILTTIVASLMASSVMANTLHCSLEEVIGDKVFQKTVIVAENSTEFVTSAAALAKGFITYTNKHVVINFTDEITKKTAYTVQPIAKRESVNFSMPIAEKVDLGLVVTCSAY